jgi:excisionase family DNA binding protein
MAVDQELTVREAASRAGRSEETIRRWIWSGRLPAVKRGVGYRIDIARLEEVIVELDAGTGHAQSAQGAGPADWRAWFGEVDAWRADRTTGQGASAADLVIEDRRGRR